MAKAKTAKPKKLLSPLLLSIAAMAGWAATHEPASFTDPGLAGSWLLTALAILLLTRALLALLLPLAGLCVETTRLLLGNLSGPSRGGADS